MVLPQQRFDLAGLRVADLLAHGQRLFEQGQALFFLAELAEQIAKVTRNGEEHFGVIGFAGKT